MFAELIRGKYSKRVSTEEKEREIVKQLKKRRLFDILLQMKAFF